MASKTNLPIPKIEQRCLNTRKKDGTLIPEEVCFG